MESGGQVVSEELARSHFLTAAIPLSTTNENKLCQLPGLLMCEFSARAVTQEQAQLVRERYQSIRMVQV